MLKRLKTKDENPRRVALNYRTALNEIELLHRLNHQNVIKLKGVCIEYGRLHALTELMDCGCLESWATDLSREFSWSLRLHIALDIARGMKYIHGQGYVHRDLTASNVLLKSTNSKEGVKAVVGDFGLATNIPKKGIQLPIVGSPFYMSPECLNSQYYDNRTDVFSFGIILIQLILRSDSDPERISRTSAYGLDYVEVGKKVKGTLCPLALLAEAFHCCLVDPKERPNFSILSMEFGRLLNSPKEHEIVADQETLASTVGFTHLKKITENIECRKRVNRKLPGGHLFSVTPTVIGVIMSELDVSYVTSPVDKSIFEIKFRKGKKFIHGSTSSDEFMWKSTDELDSSITSISDTETTLRRSHSLPPRKKKDDKDDVSELSDDADSGVAVDILKRIKSPNNSNRFPEFPDRNTTIPNIVWRLAKMYEELDKTVQSSAIRKTGENVIDR